MKTIITIIMIILGVSIMNAQSTNSLFISLTQIESLCDSALNNADSIKNYKNNSKIYYVYIIDQNLI